MALHRWFPGYGGIATVLLRFAPDFNNPPDHAHCFKHFKTSGEYPGSSSFAKELPWFRHGVTTVLHGCPRIDDPG